MRIDFVSQYFHPEQFSNNEIAQYLVRAGHEVTVTAAVPNYPAGAFFEGYSNTARRREDWGEVRIERVRTVPRGSSNLSLLLNYLAFALFGSLHLLRPRRPAPDAILVSQPSPITIFLPGIVRRWRTGAPLVCWVQDLWPESATYTLGLTNPLIVKPLGWFCGWLYRRADLILVQSEAFRPMIERFGVAPERIRHFPNTAPASYRPLDPGEAPDEAALVPQHGFRLMFAGNIGESQDFDTLVEAARRLRDRDELTWVIVGSGRDMERVQGVVRAAGLEQRFRFLGRFPEDRMPGFFAQADAMLVSLRANPIFELTVPYKVQCYLACGKPIVTSLSGEGSRIVEEAGAGITAPAGDPEKLERAIRAMLDTSAEERARMGRQARAYFEEHFARDAVYGRLEAWLAEMAQSAPRRRARRGDRARRLS